MPAAKSSAAATDDTDTPAASGITGEELAQLLTLHARQPNQWDAGALAHKFGLTDKSAAVAHALKYVRVYRAEEDATGRVRAVEIEPDAAPSKRVEP